MSDDGRPVKSGISRLVFGGRGRMALTIALIIASLVATGFVWAHKTVHIVVDGRTLDVSTIHSNPITILKEAGVTLAPQDEYRLSTDKVKSGSTITVYRAVPITVVYQGSTRTVLCGKPTVGEAVASLGITQPNIKTVPGEETPITAGLEIKVLTLTEKVVTREMTVPHTVLRQPDATMEKGSEEVVEAGQDGTKIATVKIHYADGKEVREELLSEQVTQAPRPKVIRVGTRDTVQTSRGNLRFRRINYMEATAYNPTDGSGHGITATGIPARHGIVAVDPNVIPLGTRVYIPGYGLALAADTGGAIVGNRIDLCMESYAEAYSFGRRTVKVYILAD